MDKAIASQGMLPKACWNTLGRVMKISFAPASGWMPTEESRREDDKSRQYSDKCIDNAYTESSPG